MAASLVARATPAVGALEATAMGGALVARATSSLASRARTRAATAGAAAEAAAAAAATPAAAARLEKSEPCVAIKGHCDLMTTGRRCEAHAAGDDPL